MLVSRIFALRRKRQVEFAGDIFIFRPGGDGAAQTAFLQNGKNQLFGRAWVSRRFENHQLSSLQMGINGNGGLLDVTQIRFAPLIKRRGNADNDGVGLFQLREIVGRAEVPAVDELLDLVLRNVLDVRLAGIEH